MSVSGRIKLAMRSTKSSSSPASPRPFEVQASRVSSWRVEMLAVRPSLILSTCFCPCTVYKAGDSTAAACCFRSRSFSFSRRRFVRFKAAMWSKRSLRGAFESMPGDAPAFRGSLARAVPDRESRSVAALEPTLWEVSSSSLLFSSSYSSSSDAEKSSVVVGNCAVEEVSSSVAAASAARPAAMSFFAAAAGPMEPAAARAASAGSSGCDRFRNAASAACAAMIWAASSSGSESDGTSAAAGRFERCAWFCCPAATSGEASGPGSSSCVAPSSRRFLFRPPTGRNHGGSAATPCTLPLPPLRRLLRPPAAAAGSPRGPLPSLATFWLSCSSLSPTCCVGPSDSFPSRGASSPPCSAPLSSSVSACMGWAAA
mmetsp:Transcript_3501/g.10773  ORF Transcript_3501/g.10773 Transcript_3501/m.10773 type:complete len:371 (-) Transcript_3501:144-1256(-)